MKKEFLAAFRINRMVIFEVQYYTLSTNPTPHFTTHVGKFVRNKKDWATCGQAQELILPKDSLAYKFYKKWDVHHIKDLTQEKYDEMIKDLEELKQTYEYIYKELYETNKPYSPRICFDNLKKLSMRI